MEELSSLGFMKALPKMGEKDGTIVGDYLHKNTMKTNNSSEV
jgi:hypothetical protein